MNYGVVPIVSELDNDSHLIIDHELYRAEQ